MAGLSTPDHIDTLVSSFLLECESRFRFLEQTHGFSYFSGQARYERGRQIVVPYQHGALMRPFIITTLYEKPDWALEFRFCEDLYAIEVYILHRYVHRLDLAEFLTVGKRQEENIPGPFFASTPDQVHRSTQKLCHLVEQNVELLATPNPRLMEKALAMREKLLELQIREQYKKDMERACVKAARALVEKDYVRVVSMLRPYARDLPASDQKKLALALKNLQIPDPVGSA